MNDAVVSAPNRKFIVSYLEKSLLTKSCAIEEKWEENGDASNLFPTFPQEENADFSNF